MEMDLTVEHYRTWDDLCDYMDGSAAVIGEMMLPILGPEDIDATRPHAMDHGARRLRVARHRRRGAVDRIQPSPVRGARRSNSDRAHRGELNGPASW